MADQTTLPTPEQQQRAKWDLLLTDIEFRQEQMRQLKTFEPKRLVIQALTAGGTLLAAGGVVGGVLVRLMSGNG